MNGTFYFTNGVAKVTPSFNPVHVLTHDALLNFKYQEKDTVVANFHIQGSLSQWHKKVLDEVLRNQKDIDLIED